MITSDPKELDLLRQSGRILAKTLAIAQAHVRPGVSALELDQIAEQEIRSSGACSAFKNYSSMKGQKPFPASLCVSVNDEVVHGIPSKDKILRQGDIVGLDLGVVYQGFYTDAAVTVAVGKVDIESLRLIETARIALKTALKVRAGDFTGDIGQTIEEVARQNKFNVVRELVGHGVGKSVHEDPEVPCYGKSGTGTKLVSGMVLAIEPMINAGAWKVIFTDDGWTVKTADGSRSAHFEHTVIVTENGCETLTNMV